jgi:hypothetical protein
MHGKFLILKGIYGHPGSDLMALDGSDLTYSKCMFSPQSPDITSCPDCYCAYLHEDGFLRTALCNQKRKYLCEYKGRTCPKGMILIEDTCYWIVRNPDAGLVAKDPPHVKDDPNINCRWKSGDPRHFVAELNSEVYTSNVIVTINTEQFSSLNHEKNWLEF